jgi:hypothetical protein
MPMRAPSDLAQDHQRLFAAAVLWLFVGATLLLSTLVPLHTAWLGWTPAFWLLLAPLSIALTLEPALPMRLLARRRSRRARCGEPSWH